MGLEAQATFCVPVDSMAPEPLEVVKPFHIVVRRVDEEYVATFFDANLSASGETDVEAVLNLKDIIAATFVMLRGHEPDQLGPGPRRQLAVLEHHLRDTD
jgi:hypothetical protein